VGRSTSEYDLTSRYQINFDRIEGDDDLEAVLAELAERNRTSIDEQRRGVMADEQVALLAKESAVQEQTVRALMTREAGEVGLNAEMVLASRQILNGSAVRLHGLARKITTGNATDREKLDFRRQIEFHNALQSRFMGARAEIGRALRAFRPVAYMSDTEVSERSMLITQSEIRPITHLAEAVDRAGGLTSADGVGPAGVDVGAITRVARKPLLVRAEAAFEEYFMGSILTGPATWLVNFVGSPLMQGMEVAELAVAARINQVENATRRALGAPEVEGVEIGEALATVHGFLSGAFDGLRLARDAFITGQPSMDSFVKYEIPGAPAISSEMFDLAGPLGWVSKGLEEAVRPAANSAVDFAGAVARAPMERVIQPSDEFWKAMAYRGDLGRSAFRQALTERRLGTLGDADFGRRVQELMETPVPEQIDSAQAAAIHMTFQQELGTLGQGVQTVLNYIPFFRVVTPFIKTPTNIFKEGVRRTPLGALEIGMNPQIRNDARLRQQYLARVGLGSATSAVIASMAAAGTVSGAGPSDWAAQEALRATGWRPYSIKIGDKWHSYMRGEPWSFAAGSVATMAEAIMRMDYADPTHEISDQFSDSATVLMQGIGGSFMDRTFVSGLSDFMLAAAEPSMYGESWVKRVATGSMPFSSWRRQVNKLADPYLREGFLLSEKFAQQPWIPGSSADLPYKRDILGNPKVYDSGLLGPLSPFPSVEDGKNPIHAEIRRLYESTYSPALTMPSRTMSGVRLSSRQYSRLVQLSRQEIRLGGQTFTESLQTLMNHPSYRNGANTLIDEGRIELWRSVQRQYDAAAREALVAEDSALMDRLNARDRILREYGIK
jgi:hypothetical protein